MLFFSSFLSLCQSGGASLLDLCSEDKISKSMDNFLSSRSSEIFLRLYNTVSGIETVMG